LINGLLTWWGSYLNINSPTLTLQTIFGYCFYPVAFLLGVSREGGDLLLVAKLIAEKIITVSTLLLKHRLEVLITDMSERIRCFLCSCHRPRLRWSHSPISAHCHLRLLWIRKHRFPRYSDRYPR
jgi:nucleoside permease NupC